MRGGLPASGRLGGSVARGQRSGGCEGEVREVGASDGEREVGTSDGEREVGAPGGEREVGASGGEREVGASDDREGVAAGVGCVGCDQRSDGFVGCDQRSDGCVGCDQRSAGGSLARTVTVGLPDPVLMARNSPVLAKEAGRLFVEPKGPESARGTRAGSGPDPTEILSWLPLRRADAAWRQRRARFSPSS